MSKVSFAWLIHSHQPVGNFDHVIEEAYQHAYAPFVTVLALHPRVRASLHFSGVLLEWMERRHPEYFDKLRQLVARGQVEMLGGGYYEPILPSIPDRDKLLQMERLASYLQKHFGRAPRGAWVAERVWEPSLARPLAQAGVEYVVLDDTHFLAAGLEPRELHGAYVTEEAGFPLRLVPSLKSLRYTIPFRDPEETLRVLGEGRGGEPGVLFAVGDDCEKFGVWPGTYEHCYKNGWLERFFLALEGAWDWLDTSTLSDYLDRFPPLGRTYLPTASYEEMMEWALPPPAAREFRTSLDEAERSPNGHRLRRFLRGGLWHNFLSKYAESNQIHKLMLLASQRLDDQKKLAEPGSDAAHLLRQAETHLLAAQCNDAYWHGIFGGLYAPHLRSGLLGHLIRAESTLDLIEAKGLTVITTDFDADGREEVVAEDATFGLVLRPADGGTVSSLRFKPARLELINSLRRRPEAYHQKVRELAAQSESEQAKAQGPTSIHDRVLSKESDLEELLRYDRYARHAFRTYVFSVKKRWEDFHDQRLEEIEALAGGAWTVAADPAQPARFDLACQASMKRNGYETRLDAKKIVSTESTEEGWNLECRSSLALEEPSATSLALGIEMVFNLLAPDAPDRYMVAGEERRPLRFSGELKGSRLLLVDKWQGVKILLSADPQPRWWVAPIETVSQSEAGFERIYQGSAIMAVWTTDPPPWREIQTVLRAEIVRLKP